MQHHHTQQTNAIEACLVSTYFNMSSHVMSNCEETLDHVENRFLASLEDVSLLVGTLIELDNLVEIMKLFLDY